jgi:hypothetical protein
MSGKRLKVFVVAILVALVLSIGSPVPGAFAAVPMDECDLLASGGC